MDTQSLIDPEMQRRLHRVSLLGNDPRCCDEAHDWEYNHTAERELLWWILDGEHRQFWISRIGGDSANGYEYTCSDCVRYLERNAEREAEALLAFERAKDAARVREEARLIAWAHRLVCPWPAPEVGSTFVVGWHNPTDGFSPPALHPPF